MNQTWKVSGMDEESALKAPGGAEPLVGSIPTLSAIDVSAGLVPRALREKAETWRPNEAFLLRVANAIETERLCNPDASSLDLAWAAISALGTVAKRMSARLTLIAQAEGKPSCGICGMRIFLDDNVPHPAALTVDHIVRIADGGKTEPHNLQLAHHLCNSMRTAQGRKSQRKFVEMREYLRKKMEEEGNMVPSYTG